MIGDRVARWALLLVALASIAGLAVASPAFGAEEHKLTVSLAGTGTGKVSSADAAIKCPSTCEHTYPEGTEVELTATPTTGSTFTGWSGGGCSGTGTCKVTMSTAQSLTATFAEERKLTVSLAGTGTGKVSSADAAIKCPSTCEHTYPEGTEVELTATPTAGSTFTGWSGACAGTSICKVTMNAATSVTAQFTLNEQKLTVNITGTGVGEVTSSPAGIACTTTCEHPFAEGSEVTLTATAAVGSKFTGWSGGGCTGTGTCKVTMTTAQSVTATFAEERTLTVSIAGPGNGKVGSSPAGIECPSTCEHTYPENTEVELTATATAGSTFTGWSGGGCSGTGTCKVTLSTAQAVTATFTLNEQKLSVTLTGAGAGTVTTSPTGIACTTGTCEHNFLEGTEVTLTATPQAGSTFTGWSGACSGTGTCRVTLGSPQTATANFAPAGGKKPGPPPGPTIAELEAALSGQLFPTGHGASIKALLREDGFLESFRALAGGVVFVNWYEVPRGARLTAKGKAKAKPVLVATGNVAIANSGHATLKLLLTKAGRALFAHSRRLKLTATGTFTAPGSSALSARGAFALSR